MEGSSTELLQRFFKHLSPYFMLWIIGAVISDTHSELMDLVADKEQ